MTELEEHARNTMKGGLMMMEGLEALTSQFEGEEVEDAIAETTSVMLKNADDPMRQRRIIGLVSTIGSRTNSERLQALAAKLMEDWEDG